MKDLSRKFVSCVLSLMLFGMFCVANAEETAGGYVISRSTVGGEVKFKIDKSNVDKYKDKLSPGLAILVKDWGHVLNVYETVHDYTQPKEYIEATEKYKGTARVNKNGGLENYTAGLPFPDPKTGAEVMYNYEYKYQGDDFWWTNFDLISISSNLKTKLIRGFYKRLAYQGRLTLGPVSNPDKVELKEISCMTYPEDIAGLALLTVRYQDASKGDDGWMYIPTIRRVRRISVAQRSDTFAGTDFTWDDYRGLSGKIADFNWTLIGKKEMYVAYHTLTNHQRVKGKLMHPDDLRYELRTVLIIDGVNKNKDYSYGKMRVYLDTDSWAMTSDDIYDRKGNLWKYNEVLSVPDLKNHVMFQYGQCIFDLIAMRSTLATKTILKTNVGLKEADFSTTKLQTQSR